MGLVRSIVSWCGILAVGLEAWALPEEIVPVVQALDRFMMAGKEGDASRGAQLLDRYETSPRRTEREIGEFFERNRAVFESYQSIAKDIYGYEFKEKGYRGRNVELEGGLETEPGLGVEFSARLVFRDGRWWILSLEID